MIARDPECGVVMKCTGGVRKVRFAVGGKGKERWRSGRLLIP